MTDAAIRSSLISDARLLHSTLVEPTYGPARGASPQEVAELERLLGFELPLAYKEFLEWMGRDYHGIFCGSDCFVDHIIDNRDVLLDLLRDNGVDFPLPERFVCFFTHQGYIAAWFGVPTPDNPDCWFFAEGKAQAPQPCGSFSRFLADQISDLVAPELSPNVASRIPRWLSRVRRWIRSRR